MLRRRIFSSRLSSPPLLPPCARKTEQVAAAMRRGGALESGILRACLTLFSRIRTYGTKFQAGEIRLRVFPLGLFQT